METLKSLFKNESLDIETIPAEMWKNIAFYCENYCDMDDCSKVEPKSNLKKIESIAFRIFLIKSLFPSRMDESLKSRLDTLFEQFKNCLKK